jgi:hypothetical protein
MLLLTPNTVFAATLEKTVFVSFLSASPNGAIAFAPAGYCNLASV